MSTTTQDTGSEGLVDQAKAELADAASTAQDKAVELKEQGRSKLSDTLDQRTTEVGGQALPGRRRCCARVSSQLAQADTGGQQVAHLTQLAADQVEHLGAYLERASGDQLLRDAEDFARRRPWMVAGIGLVAGLAASRFLKASSERRYGASGSTGAGNGHSYSTASRAGGERVRAPDARGRRLGRVTTMGTVNRSASRELRDKPIGEVASDLTRDLSLLVRQEIALARAEMTEKGKTPLPRSG